MATCPEIEVRGQELCVSFPGGISICAQVPSIEGPTPDVLSRALVGQAASALGPLQPIFDIIGAVLALSDFATAIPEAILTLDPDLLTEPLEELAEKVATLLRMIPQLSVPILILDLVDAIINYLNGLLDFLSTLENQQLEAEYSRGIAVSYNLSVLLAAVECAEEHIISQLGNMAEGAKTIDSFIATINLFGSLVPNMPVIPSFGDIGDDVSSIREGIEELIELLETARDLIPLP
jgi:hypothetical protein